jgi:hypothetical protein
MQAVTQPPRTYEAAGIAGKRIVQAAQWGRLPSKAGANQSGFFMLRKAR